VSTRRTKRGGYVDPSRLPKGPNGRALCRQCSTEVPVGRRTFCSEGCVDGWRVKTDPTFMRQAVLHRDRGICAECGTDTLAIEQDIRNVQAMDTTDHKAAPPRWKRPPGYIDGREHARASVLRLHGINPATSRTSFWDADHKVPVIEGGGECDLDNIRTLCIPCHQRVTAELAARRADARQREKLASQGVTLLPGMPAMAPKRKRVNP
jgi:5-methylcytosine-specific restriction endonuclease McrA